MLIVPRPGVIMVASGVRLAVVAGEAVTNTTATEAKGDEGDDEGSSVPDGVAPKESVDCWFCCVDASVVASNELVTAAAVTSAVTSTVVNIVV